MTNRLFPILAFLLALVIFFGYVNPTWTGSISAMQVAIATDNQALTAAADYVTRENQLASARNAIDPANLLRLSTFLPDTVNNVRLILDLNQLTARSGLTLNSISVVNPIQDTSGSATAGNPVGSVDLTLSASGSYAALKAFLKSIEQSARLLDVNSLSVTGSDTGIYAYTMNVRLYWLR